jgi:hypothetical protein
MRRRNQKTVPGLKIAQTKPERRHIPGRPQIWDQAGTTVVRHFKYRSVLIDNRLNRVCIQSGPFSRRYRIRRVFCRSPALVRNLYAKAPNALSMHAITAHRSKSRSWRHITSTLHLSVKLRRSFNISLLLCLELRIGCRAW